MVRCLADALRFALPLLAAASAEQEPSPDLPTPLRNERAATAGGGVGALGGALAATLGSDSIAAVSSHLAAADATAMAVAAVDATGHATALTDPGAADAAAAASPHHPLLDASGAALSGALNTRCQYAVSNALARDAAAEPPPVHPSDLSSLVTYSTRAFCTFSARRGHATVSMYVTLSTIRISVSTLHA